MIDFDLQGREASIQRSITSLLIILTPLAALQVAASTWTHTQRTGIVGNPPVPALPGVLLLTDVGSKIGFVYLYPWLYMDLKQPGAVHGEIDLRNGVAPVPDRLGSDALHSRVIRRAMTA